MIFKTRMEMSLENYRSEVTDPSGQLTLKKVENPDYETYRDLHNKVGEPYGWDKRARINDIPAMQKLLAATGTGLWRFFRDITPIGYALFSGDEGQTAELEDFGFFPQYCDHGYGAFFLSKTLEQMMLLGIRKVWLTSRSTNHPKVVSFYQKMGFQITDQMPVAEEGEK